MKQRATGSAGATAQSSDQASTAQQLNALRLRVLKAKSGFLQLGTEIYMPFIDAQATREGRSLDATEKLVLRQVMNGRVSINDEDRVALIERALEFQQAA